MPDWTRRSLVLAAIALGAGLATPHAVAQETTPEPDAEAPAAPEATGPPKLTSLRLARTVRAQRGHARFLVGVRLNVDAQILLRVISASNGDVKKTIQTPEAHAAGRAYFLIDATDDEGFQLPSGAYRVEIQATSSTAGASNLVRGSFRLRLSRGRGRFDAYTVPTWKATARNHGTTSKGLIVAVVAPQGAAAAAGVRRGDVLVALNRKRIDSPGALVTAQRGLPAEREVSLVIERDGQRMRLNITPPPDWEDAPDYGPSLRVASRRDPKSLAVAIASARNSIETGELDAAQELLDAWPRSWRISAPGQVLSGELFAARSKHKQALGAYNRARKRDRNIARAEFGRGIALAALQRPEDSAVAFAAAERLDPKDAAAAAFRSYVLIRAEINDEAARAAQRSIGLDQRYADAHLPHGIAQIALDNRAGGIRALRTGLLLLDEEDRAARLIDRHLEPIDP